MTIIDLPHRTEPVTPRAPIMTPVLGSEAAEKHIAALDEDLDFLFCIAGTVSGTQDVPDEAVHALRTLHARMKKSVQALFNLG